jgi:serine/threonine-protein kinase
MRWIREGRVASGRTSLVAAVAAGAVTLAVAALIAFTVSRPADEQPEVVRLELMVPQGADGRPGDPPVNVMRGTGSRNLAISPDGRRVACVVQRGTTVDILVRRLDSNETITIRDGFGPFFSADNEWLGYNWGNEMWKVPAAGGERKLIHRANRGAIRGASWAPDGSIYFAPGPGTGLWRIPAGGGPASEISRPNRPAGENSHRWPQLLPDGRHLLFTIRTDSLRSFDEARIAVLSLQTGRWKVVLDGGSSGRFVPPGQLVFGRGGAIYAAPFDLESLEVTGPHRKVVGGIRTESWSGAADFDVSSSGDLVYVPGTASAEQTEVVRMDRSGKSSPFATMPLRAHSPVLSPNGRSIAFTSAAANDDIAVYDLESGSTTRLSFERGDEWSPVWTADGTRVIYGATEPARLMSRRVDGGGESVVLLSSAVHGASSCSADGSAIAYTDLNPSTGFDLWILPLQKDRRPRVLLRTPFNEYDAQFSPDGRWITYVSNESGRPEVYVRSLENSGGRWRVSTEGGRQGRWSADGREIFYRSGDDLMAVTVVKSGSELKLARPAVLFQVPDVWTYGVIGDGFLAMRPVETAPTAQQVNVVLNWSSEID